MSRTVTSANFHQEISVNPNLSLVLFRIEWSGTCQIMTPVYEELSYIYKGHADFFTVDVEAEKELERVYGIQELPTILFFREGKVVDHTHGLVSRNVMITKIVNALTN